MRQRNKQNFRNSVALVVDGDDEMWYMENIKKHYPSPSLKRMKISPEFPKHKKVDELFAFAQELVEKNFNRILLIVDMDNVLKDDREFEKFKVYYAFYVAANKDKLIGRSKNKWIWMKNIILVINTPCVEYWYLLHYGKTTKFYADYDSMKNDLRRKQGLEEYEKSKDYYNRVPDIYTRLGGEKGIEAARANAVEFKLAEAHSKGISEMHRIFNFFDILDKNFCSAKI